MHCIDKEVQLLGDRRGLNVDLYRAKELLEKYGNVLVLQRDYNSKEFEKFVSENSATVTGPHGTERYMVITCKDYRIPEEERHIKKSKFYNQYLSWSEMLSEEEFEKKRIELLKKRNTDLLKKLKKEKEELDKLAKKD